MPGVAIVAIPKQDDYVWNISSEKVPHMTLLYLGDSVASDALARIEQFLQHLSETVLHPFYAETTHRGTLGPDNADVIFFRKNDMNLIAQARAYMLAEIDINVAYNSTDQFPEWTPHLTLGYPTAPAHPDPRDYPGISYVQFDKIALWTGNFEGPTFDLPERSRNELEVGMSLAEKVLEHHGVKGMKWGVRKDDSPSGRVATLTRAGKTAVSNEAKARTGEAVVVRNKPGEGVRTVGGNKQLAHPDAVKVRTNEQIVKRSTTDAISTKDLQELVNRMNLEAQYRTLASREYRTTAGEKYASELLVSVGQKAATKAGLGDTVGPQIQEMIAKRSPLANKGLAGGKIKGDGNNN